MFKLLLANRAAFLGGILLLLGVGIVLCLALSTQRVPTISLNDYHVYSCSTDAGNGSETFGILTVVSLHARNIADHLCRSPIMARHYGAVRISWRPRRQLNAEEILAEEYDLIWSRIHNMRGLLPEFADYYDTLLRYDHYQVFWYSREPLNGISAENLRGKKIGLLNDRLSHTHYLLPLSSLKEAGINLDGQELVYFDDLSVVYEAFARGDLDLISAGSWLERDMKGPLYRSLIAADATAATLFVRKARDPAIDCEIASAFAVFGQTLSSAQRHFFGEGDCEE